MKLINPKEQNRLVLFPVDPKFRITSPDAFHGELQAIGLLGATGPGPEFMKLLTFMGCSPSIGSGLQESDYNNYSIEICVQNNETALLVRSRLRSPVCPRCGAQNNDTVVVDQVEEAQGVVAWRCPGCHAKLPVTDINWRHRLAVATDYIVVHGVHDGEVIPSDRLLEYLTKVTGVGWSYCYC